MSSIKSQFDSNGKKNGGLSADFLSASLAHMVNPSESNKLKLTDAYKEHKPGEMAVLEKYLDKFPADKNAPRGHKPGPGM